MKKLLISVLVLGTAALAALLVIRHLRPAAPLDTHGAPLHFFLEATHGEPDLIGCSFTGDREDREMSALWQEGLQPCNLGTGWTNPSPGGLISMTRRPTFDIHLPSPNWSVLLLRVRAYENPDSDATQTMDIEVNGHPIGTVEVAPEWTTVELGIPDGVLQAGNNRIAARFGYRVRPVGKKDYRHFSVRLRGAGVAREPGDGSISRFNRFVSDPTTAVEKASVATFDPRSEHFEISQPGRLGFPVIFDNTANRLEFEIGTAGSDPAITLHIRSMTGHAGGQDQSPPITLERDGKILTIAADVREFAGDTCLVALEITDLATTRRRGISVSPPRITTSPGTPADKVPPLPMAGVSTRPDIVLITLDAARARNFSCYGYDRNTTPNLDALADESLVFQNAYALAPYTLCSVPTMVTGHSFLDHQVTRHGQRLSPDATTLAEYLKLQGYRTGCFTASPNNSRTLGTDQGYDDFVETWKVVPRPGSTEPFLLSKMATEWLSQIDESTPFHLQLHYVPPHSPYDPEPRFDVFTDPAYDGKYDGSHTTINSLDSDLWDPRPEDFAEVVARYDGNLRAGDAAVAEVLDALRRRPRWRDTLVLVTSDHGEAFLEHGRMSHNSTVFDEMLHVPFILRLPAGFDAPAVQTDRLVSLADIVPTLLAAAGGEADSGLAGVNLLSHADGGTPAKGRFIVARTANKSPLYALRTLGKKLILASSGQGLLFDVAADPGELVDLALSEPEVFAGLGRLLTHRLAQPPLLEAAAEAEEIPDEDAEMLKALGYVQ